MAHKRFEEVQRLSESAHKVVNEALTILYSTDILTPAEKKKIKAMIRTARRELQTIVAWVELP